MTDQTDPFFRHPELRDRIADHASSFFRDFSVEKILRQFPEMEAAKAWTHPDPVREALRAQALAGHEGDLWVFAYGSLMWDPALRFAEVRRAQVAGFARRMILMEVNGGRGTHEAPGLMAALDRAADSTEVCGGLVFRIAAEDVETETEILCRRELIGPGYLPVFVTAQCDDGPVQALTFLADHSTPEIRPDLTHAEQVRCVAHGVGILGTSRDYLASIVNQFAALDIQDEGCVTLLRDVDARLASANPLNTQTDQ